MSLTVGCWTFDLLDALRGMNGLTVISHRHMGDSGPPGLRLNAAHKLKRSVFFHACGEIRDPFFESEAFRASGLIWLRRRWDCPAATEAQLRAAAFISILAA